MTLFKSGDLVMLKSGGPTMTVDTVNTDIFDDSKITGVLCVWFVGEKLERVRFDHRAIESARLKKSLPGRKGVGLEEASGEYKVVLDEMVAALNIPADTGSDAPRKAVRKPKSVADAEQDAAAASPVVDDVAARQSSTRAGGLSHASAPNRLDAAAAIRPQLPPPSKVLGGG